MKLQELIHIHALLYEVGEYIEQDDGSSVDPFARYEAQPTRPHHVHRGKDAHQTAINRLLHGCSQSSQRSDQRIRTVSTETTPR